MQQARSAIPKVVGILMIVFASLGLLQSVISMIQAELVGETFHGHEMQTFAHVSLVFGLLDLGIGVLHLAAGLRSVGYKESAPRLTMLYGVLKIVTTIGLLVVTYAFMRRALTGADDTESAIVGFGFIVAGIFYMAWPIVAMSLMSRPSAKAACVNL
jgi:hypothetical protein